jgi:hypothetical protein
MLSYNYKDKQKFTIYKAKLYAMTLGENLISFCQKSKGFSVKMQDKRCRVWSPVKIYAKNGGPLVEGTGRDHM